MKRLLIAAALLSSAAIAGELCKGPDGRPMVLVSQGASTNNLGTTADAGFQLGASLKITAQCFNLDGGSAGATICVNEATCTSLLGVFLSGNQALPTSTAQNRVALADGGLSAQVSMISTELNACKICIRAGNEF